MPPRSLLAGALLAALTTATACGSSPSGPPDAFTCAQESRADTYTAGLEKTADSGAVVKLMESTPAPPDRGDNTWMVEITDATGTPLAGLDVTVTPEMPDHGHGTSIPTIVSPGPTDGSYQLDPVNLWMPGYWEVTVALSDGADLDDEVMFKFCVE